METLVGGLDRPEPLPPEVPFFTKPKRDSDAPDGILVWTGTLALLYQVDLTATSFAELVDSARHHLDEAFPDQAVPMRVYIVPDGPVGSFRSEQIAEVSVWPPGNRPPPAWLG
jgi:hypothetical protein